MNKALESRHSKGCSGQKLRRDDMNLVIVVIAVAGLAVRSRQVEDIFDTASGLFDRRFVENIAANPLDVQIVQLEGVR